jgi:hypothetical protein
MGNAGKKNEAPAKERKTPNKPPPLPVADEDREDGDIATPKFDRYGTDDEPL